MVRALSGQQRVAARDEPLTREAGALELDEVVLLEQSPASRP
jgi:hypothetical protein